jgi:methionyl-tRNA formyltransferase
MVIQVLVDNPNSWILPYTEKLVQNLIDLGHRALLLHDENEVVQGDILCLLSCEKIFKKLHLNKHNLVVHESDLPKGKGWSPVSWQVLEGKSFIPVTLFEATSTVDNGRIYNQMTLELQGHELWPEIKDKQGIITQQLILNFVNEYPNNHSREQVGDATYYAKRTPEHSQLDFHKTIAEQFNLFRVCDNERYPAFFIKDGKKYILKIEKS